VFLILDNLRVHHSKIVKKWVADNSKKIKLFYLPFYSPDRNPDEYLNCDLKYNLSDKPAPKTQEKMNQNLENYMIMLQNDSQRVVKYFKHKSIKYAA
jgi:transposase